MTKPPLVSLIIPAYNEEKSISAVINKSAKIMGTLQIPFEIIVVNDGSNDNTEAFALLSSNNVRVIKNKTNCGKGYSIRRAVECAKGDVIVTLDSDGQHDPAEIPALLAPLFNGADIVSGSRFLGSKRQVTSRLNQLGNHFFNFTIILLTGRRITDSQTGFRAMKRGIFNELKLESNGYEIETEITVKSLLNGFSFKEVPVTVMKRSFSVSKIKILPDSKKIVAAIIKSSMADI